MFQIVFEYVRRKASMMKYWDGSKRTMRPRKRPSSVEATENLLQSPDYEISEELSPHAEIWTCSQTFIRARILDGIDEIATWSANRRFSISFLCVCWKGVTNNYHMDLFDLCICQYNQHQNPFSLKCKKICFLM